jgi:hypothetical protein
MKENQDGLGPPRYALYLLVFYFLFFMVRIHLIKRRETNRIKIKRLLV